MGTVDFTVGMAMHLYAKSIAWMISVESYLLNYVVLIFAALYHHAHQAARNVSLRLGMAIPLCAARDVRMTSVAGRNSLVLHMNTTAA
ncbi:MAG: hypothetical protein OYH77_06165 [Pseudomonadota bacterium]|nr:hypothetical protein [Pseudomonadota bacterium]